MMLYTKIKTNPLVVELKFRIETQRQNNITSEVKTSETFYDGDEEEGLSLYIKSKVETSERFTQQETVYGGEEGLKLYIKPR